MYFAYPNQGTAINLKIFVLLLVGTALHSALQAKFTSSSFTMRLPSQTLSKLTPQKVIRDEPEYKRLGPENP